MSASERRKFSKMRRSTSRLRWPKLDLSLILLLCLFHRILYIAQCQTDSEHEDHRPVNNQHLLTRLYHDIQQNEIYKRHDTTASGSRDIRRETASLRPPTSTQEISLRQVLVPLLSGASELNLRPPHDRREKLFDYKSSNNRGPANPDPHAIHHQAQPIERHTISRFIDPSWRFGERRRQDVATRQLENSFKLKPARGDTEQVRVAKKPISWSQPDPRTAYSLPVSLVSVPKSGAEAAKRPTAQGVARLLSTGSGGATLRLPSEALKRNEPESMTTTQQVVSTFTQAPEFGVAPFESGESENELESDHYQTPEPFLRQQKSMKTPADEDETQPKSAMFGGRTNGANQVSHRQQSTPMVTLIRYVPLVMNLPAERVAVLASGQKVVPHKAEQAAKQVIDMSASISPSVLEQIYRPQGDQAGHKYQALAAAKYHLIDSLLPTANEPKLAPTASQSAIVDGTSGDISSEYSHLYPSSSALQLNTGQPALALAANGQQLTRLAYIPVGQPQVALASGHATSKALSAYASRLISMLRPSSLLSSIGGSSSHAGAHFGLQQQPAMPHIYLLAPAEPLVPPTSALHPAGATIKSTSRPALNQALISVQQKPEDTLLNQSSRVHSTKSQRQPTSGADQMRWPLAPQMNGLVCIQGLIKTKQPAKQQQRQQPISQTQMQDEEATSFDFERPQQRAEQSSKSFERHTTGGKTSSPSPTGKSPKSSEQMRQKMSPMRMMQKMASKKLKSSGQQHEFAASYTSNEQEETPITQQKLMGSSSDNNSILDAREHDAGAGQQSQNLDQKQAQQSQQLQQEQESKRSSIIPFTIRDKIDVPAIRARSYRPNGQAESVTTTQAPNAQPQTNGPVQYDEPSESDLNLAARNGASADLDQHWSRTSFVSSSPRSAAGGSNNRQLAHGSHRNQQSPSYSTEIDYRKDTSAGAPSGASNGLNSEHGLPVFMASSSSSGEGRDLRSRLSSIQPSGASLHSDERQGGAPMSPSAALARPTGSAPPPPARSGQSFSGFQNEARFASHELMGSPSSSSSISTTTTSSALPSATEPSKPGGSSGPPTSGAHHSSLRLAPDELGQLISSISLSRDSAGSGGQPDGRPESKRSAQTSASAASTPDTLELVINSTPRETSTTTALQTFASGRPDEPDHLVSENITASPLYPAPAASTLRPEAAASADEPDGQSEWLANMNSFSHDRTLSSGSPAAAAQFGRISESLQTNPLDLIDLQNSRSSFELPAQLESLSMFHGSGQSADAHNRAAPAAELEPSESARHSTHRTGRQAAHRGAALKRGKLASVV